MGFGSCIQNDDNTSFSRNYPDVDADGYVENWWKRAVDDCDPSD